MSNIREASGQVRKVSVAIVINSLAIGDGADWTPERLALMTDLARDAVGFDEQRGDTISLHSLPFIQPLSTVPAVPGWQAAVQDYTGKSLVDMLGMLISGLVILCIVLLIRVVLLRRRATRALLESPDVITVAPVEMAKPDPEPVFSTSGRLPLALEQTRMLANECPELVAHILKQWLKPE